MASDSKNHRAAVLVVEDDESLARSIAGILGDSGYTVTVCGDGGKGLDAAKTGEFDAVLTDFRLPGLGGMALIEALQASNPRLPVIMMTSHGSTDTAIGATKIGAFDYLVKPFETAELTGADSHRIGRLQQADGGTLFLDEIGDMPASIQVKLLRALQEKRIQPLGSSEDLAVDVSEAIDLANGRQGNASQWLGISRVTLRQKLARYAIAPRSTSSTSSTSRASAADG